MTLLKDLPVCIIESEMAFNQDIKAIVPNAEIDTQFIAYYLIANKNRILNLVDTAGHGTGRLDTGLLKDFELLIPHQREQRRIADLLTTWDRAIAATQNLLENSRKQKQSLARKLMGSISSENVNWKKYHLGELFNERNETARSDLPLVSITQSQGVILREDVGRKDTSTEDKSKYLRICRCDIGYNTMRMWQGVSALSAIEGIVSPAYTVIRPNNKIDGEFAAHFFKLDRIISVFCRHSQGLVSDTWNLKFPHFAKIQVSIRTIEEQRRIVQVLNLADQSIKIVHKKLEALQKQKSALMSQLLTGKRRLRLPDTDTDANANATRAAA